MCWVISQLITLWHVRHELSVDHADTGVGGDSALLWAPWDHIHPQSKGSPTPLFNVTGKYCVRLYWMVSELLYIPVDMKQIIYVLLCFRDVGGRSLWMIYYHLLNSLLHHNLLVRRLQSHRKCTTFLSSHELHISMNCGLLFSPKQS